jgi:hypothetical protein
MLQLLKQVLLQKTYYRHQQLLDWKLRVITLPTVITFIYVPEQQLLLFHLLVGAAVLQFTK